MSFAQRRQYVFPKMSSIHFSWDVVNTS